MIQVDDKILSELLFERKFVCDLEKCKGACCVEGDAGAPLEEDELQELEKAYPIVKKYLSEKAQKAIEKNGLYTKDEDGEWVTALVDGKECVFTVFDENGMASCGIEKAYLNNEINFKKPVSCHLYPIRVAKYHTFEAINYHHWDLCTDACVLGEQLGVKVYKFLKEPLIRKYGQEFYSELEKIDEALENERK
jgi:hypothetical protein